MAISLIQQEARTLTESTKKWVAVYRKGSKVNIDSKYNAEQANIFTKDERKKCKYGKVKEIMDRYKKNSRSFS